MQEEDRKISLQRHRRHQKINGWKRWGRVILYMIFLVGIYFFIQRVFVNQSKGKKKKNIETPINIENYIEDSSKKKAAPPNDG